jgi:hypothetical protein
VAGGLPAPVVQRIEETYHIFTPSRVGKAAVQHYPTGVELCVEAATHVDAWVIGERDAARKFVDCAD